MGHTGGKRDVYYNSLDTHNQSGLSSVPIVCIRVHSSNIFCLSAGTVQGSYMHIRGPQGGDALAHSNSHAKAAVASRAYSSLCQWRHHKAKS